jgi:DEAD/DEAH box helicase domain-containing protein
MKTLIYDLEIIRCIPGKVRFSDFDYCDGWRDFANMGISVAAYGWFDREDPIVFDWADDVARSSFIQAIKAADIISGFNSSGFDDHLLAANGVEVKTTYDILFECRLAAYGSFDYRDQPEGHSYALDPICRSNGLVKTGSGSLAPQWWQLGEKEKVRRYCQNDVRIEREVLRLALDGALVDPNSGQRLSVRPLAPYQY